MKEITLTEEEEAKRLYCCEQKMTDQQGADYCGIAKSSFGAWRKRRGIPAVVRVPWTEKEKRVALKMYSNGAKFNDIVKKINKTYDSVKNFINRNKEMLLVKASKKADKRSVKEEDKEKYDDAKRLACHAAGLSDKDSAAECYMSKSDYTMWRIDKGLKENPEIVISPKKIKTKSSALTAADCRKYYKHNTHKPLPSYKSELIVTVDKEKAERLLAELETIQRESGNQTVFCLNGKLIGNQSGRTMAAITAYGR